MEILKFVNELILDFANKTAKAKCNGCSDNEKDIIKNDFLSKMLLLRERYPELLFINYPSDLNEEEASAIFRNIKESVKDVYELDKLVCPQFYSCNIDGINFEIPGTVSSGLDNNYGGVYTIDYDSVEDKVLCINQTLLHSLMLLPIKKITLSFVDLKCSYEYELFLRNLPSVIYNEKPVTTDEQMEKLLKRLEKRREDIIKKCSDYGDYCKQNQSIPLPYEIIVLYDEHFDVKYWDRLNSLIEWCKRIGVLLIIPRKKRLKSCSNLFSCDIINSNGKEAYKQNYGDWWIPCIEPEYTGLFLNRDVLDPMVDPFEDSCRPNKSKTLIEDIQNIPEDDHVIIGSGNYEVILECVKTSKNYVKAGDYGFLLHDVERTNGLLGLFPSEQDALNYMNEFCLKYNNPKFCLYPLYLEFRIETNEHLFSSDTYKIGLSINEIIIENHEEELMFYLTLLGLSKDMKERIISILKGEKYPEEYGKYGKERGIGYGCSFFYWKDFSSKDEVIDYLFKQLLPQIENKAEQMWGKNYKFSHLYFCVHDNTNWGVIKNSIPQEYVERDGGLGDLHLVVKKKDYISVPIEHFETPVNDGLINFTPITNNPTLLKACFEYIRTEAEAKEEMKVQNLDFDSAAESKYETDLSMMVIPVGKAESKDADFRMDLVSHVHSFIIGQSGSGKSVFLHNIIGGAMLKYAPEDLQLYLLDFKLGGVEFNRYKGAKHVKALLVDNSDPQVTLEILRELRGSMTERGKLLRSAGVNNIGEYNKLHQEDRMPHVLVVADECHEMFKADDSIPRQVRNEISDIVIKIAKEGRSQGVHLVFATQTLSGTEISSEIINNVSDFYLLKCAQTDSERLVPNSSNITSELSTGQIYYHHVEEQVKFQAYYTDKEAAEKLMAAIVEKAKDHKSNGEFYFNGAQMFYLDDAVKEEMSNVKGKSPLAFMGKAIDISQKDLYIKLNEDFSENVLLLGLNDQEQVTRTTMNLFVSLMMSAKLKHKDIAFKVIDCLNNEEGEVHELIFDLENAGYCDIIERRQRSKFFKELAQDVQDGSAEETILLILGQDRFRELKMDMELEESNSNKSNDDDDMMSISDDFFGDNSSSSSSVRTYREALNVILEKGPDYGVHTMLQLEKASNLLFEDYITPKVVFQKFKHLVMLKSDETAGVTLHLNDEIRLEKLSSDWERLRAYYYAEESDSYTLFTPYMPSKSKDIINLLNTI